MKRIVLIIICIFKIAILAQSPVYLDDKTILTDNCLSFRPLNTDPRIKLHRSVDLPCNNFGSEVKAIADGQVYIIQNNYCIIQNNDGSYYRYAHIICTKDSVGELVATNETIGFTIADYGIDFFPAS